MNKSMQGRARAARTSACALGLFGIALGVAEICAPRALARFLGVRGAEPLIRAFGAREIVSGLGILFSRDPTHWVSARLAGDAVDLAALGAGLANSERKGALALAAVSVAGVTLADAANAAIL